MFERLQQPTAQTGIVVESSKVELSFHGMGDWSSSSFVQPPAVVRNRDYKWRGVAKAHHCAKVLARRVVGLLQRLWDALRGQVCAFRHIGGQVTQRFQSDVCFHSDRIQVASPLAYYEFWNGLKG